LLAGRQLFRVRGHKIRENGIYFSRWDSAYSFIFCFQQWFSRHSNKDNLVGIEKDVKYITADDQRHG